MLLQRRNLLAASLSLLSAFGVTGVHAQETYPSKPITFISPYPAGSTIDVVARALADPLAEELGQPVIVENKVGGGGALAAEILAQTEPDGYTLVLATNSLFAVIPQLREVQYDPLTDLDPIAFIADAYMPFVINPSVPADNLAELIEYAKAHPGELAWGSAGIGTVGHLSGEYLKQRAGIDIHHVPYSGDVGAIVDAVSGDVQISFDTQAVEYVASGRLKPIAVLTKQPWDKLPGVPTIAEAGIENWEPRSWYVATLPAGAPQEVVERLHEAFAKVVSDPATLARFETIGIIGGTESIEQIDERVQDDWELFGRLIEQAGIKIN